MAFGFGVLRNTFAAFGGVLSFFGERKVPKNAARNRMVSGLPFRSTSGIFGRMVPKFSIVSTLAPLPLTL